MLLYSTVDENIRKQKLQDVKCWLLDIDGTISIGEDLLPGADKFFDALTDQRFIFVTNNSSHSADYYVKRMSRIGIPTKRENVLTSTDALIMYLKKIFDKDNITTMASNDAEKETEIENETKTKTKTKTDTNADADTDFNTNRTNANSNADTDFNTSNTNTNTNIITDTNANTNTTTKKTPSGTITVFPVGTPDFEMELLDAGIEIVKEKEKQINAVLLAFDTTLTYDKLDIACDYIRAGVPYIAANPDKVCPLADGKVLPDCGAILAFIQTCTGVAPAKIIGKPDTSMSEMIISKYGYRQEELAMVGDRIYTDLAFAKNAGILSIAVLTGEATLDEIIESRVEPEFIFEKIADIEKYLKKK